jgi:putative acyl-CoA dehydrogenase
MTTIAGAANQAPPLEGYNLFEQNRPLVEALRREGAGWAEEQASALGVLAGGDPLEWGRLANENPPVLRTHDRYGNRIDEVEFHPAWHALLRMSIGAGAHSLCWREERPGAHVARAAIFYVTGQVEWGHGCPVSMTHAVVPALRIQPDLAAEWEPQINSLEYDPGLRPAPEKRGVLVGMALTEKQGGSDVRANTMTARRVGDGEYELDGHKWFCSAPMCDAFLVLAQTDAGLGCFFVPRVLPDGTRNRFHIQRLKDKLGNRSNASSEIELHGAWARLVGEEGRGVRTIIEMVNQTRLDCVIGSAAQMRAGVEQATHHTAHRSAFGKLLAEQPLMQNVLADLCIESEAATATALRLARAYDDEPLFARLATAVAKYWVCKRASGHAAESLECVGGNGYVEESGLPRLYRESPLNGIWEGSGNVIALDVLRVLTREPQAVESFLAEVELAAGEPRLDAWVERAKDELRTADEDTARRLVERLALALQASLLIRHAPHEVADAFVASRLASEGQLAYGTLPRGTDFAAIIERNRPSIG